MAESVMVAGEDVAFDEALAVIVGYCLGPERTAIAWAEPDGGVGESVGPIEISAFAYSTYDEIAGSPGAGIEPIDILVANGLNAKMGAREIALALAVGPEVSAALAAIPADCRFWELDASLVVDRPDEADQVAWSIWRAWTVLIGVPGIDLARTHKILHHKRPAVFPLIDNKTKAALGDRLWATIHDDLNADQGVGWDALEAGVNQRLRGAGRVEATRLRMHDILLWCRVLPDQWQTAEELGRSILNGGD